MNRDTNSEHPLLSAYPQDDGDVITQEKRITVTPKPNWLRAFSRPVAVIAIICISFASITLNVILLWLQYRVFHERIQNVQSAPYSSLMGKSAYTGLALDTPSTHFHHTDYWGPNRTLADALWESVDTNPMVVALTDEFAKAHDLPLSDRFPWDETKGRYFVKVFHQLHCLVCSLHMQSLNQTLILP